MKMERRWRWIIIAFVLTDAGVALGLGQPLEAELSGATCDCESLDSTTSNATIYHFCGCFKTWDEAELYCSSTYPDGRLTPVHDQATQDFLVQSLGALVFETRWRAVRAGLLQGRPLQQRAG